MYAREYLNFNFVYLIQEMMIRLEESKNLEAAERQKLEDEIRAKQEEVKRIQTEIEIKNEHTRRLEV